MTQKPSYEELEARVKVLEQEASERKRRQKSLRIQKAYFERLFDSAPEAVVLADKDHRIMRINTEFTRMFGYGPEEARGKTCDQIIVSAEHLDEASDITSRVARGEAIRTETVRRRKDGTPLVVELMAAPVRVGSRHIGDYVSYRDITDRKDAQKRLREREAFIRSVMDNLPIGIAVNSVDPSVEFSYMNDNFPRFYRITREALVEPDLFWDAVYEDPQFREKMKRKVLEDCLSADPGRMHWEDVPITRGGETAYISAKNIPVPDTKLMISTVWDVTERKRAEEALAKSERFYRTVLSSLYEDILIIDRDYRITNINNTALKTLGVDREKAVGRYCFEISHHLAEPCHMHGEQCSLNRVFETGESVNLHHVHAREDGTRVHVDILMSPLRDDEGRITHVVEAARDVTDLFLYEEALRRSEQLLNDAQTISKIGGWEYDVETKRITWTNEVYRIYGVGKDYDPNNIENDISFYAEQDRAKIRGAFMNAIAGGESYDLELGFIASDGTKKWVRTVGKPIVEKDRVVRVLGNIIDITERKKEEEEKFRLQEQLRQFQKVEAIGQLAGGVAHDFNNALTVILGNTEMMLGDVGKTDPLYENIVETRKAGERAAKLTRQLLAFSRKQILQPEVLNLNEVVLGIEKMLRRTIRENIELETDLADDLGMVEADPGQIEQVILNLAVNARDAMPMGGKLMIETGNVNLDRSYARNHAGVTPGPYVMLSVSDTGIGMTKEVQERIFEPFFTTKERGKGTGLGLSTVYGIVKQSKGNIWVYSEPGKGAAFKIYLPEVKKAVTPRKEATGEIQIPLGSETVLAVEDEEMVRSLVSNFLGRFGYRVLAAANGEEALRICREHEGPIHLLLTDVVMPGLSGREIAKQAKELRPQLKVLYMSGYTDNAIVKHGILEKGVAFIQKPFTQQGLAWRVRGVLDE